MILCSDGSLYTGITNDIARRWRQHASQRGAKYFRGRRPRQLVYLENGHTRSSASRQEALIKRMPRQRKQRLIGSADNQVAAFDCAELAAAVPG